MIREGTLQVLSNKCIGKDHNIITFEKEGLFFKPGQFLMLDCIPQRIRKFSADRGDPMLLLRRPFSVYLESNDNDFSILYKRCGQGTEFLTQAKRDDRLSYLFPDVKGVDIREIIQDKNLVHLIAGGTGVAPITFLAQKLVQAGCGVKIYLGVRQVGEFLDFCLDTFRSLGINDSDVSVSSDSSIIDNPPTYSYNVCEVSEIKPLFREYKGKPVIISNIIEALNVVWFSSIEGISGNVCVCAPDKVMEYVHYSCVPMWKEVYTFMEKRMACGMGICMGCATKDIKVCKNGACVNSKKVGWKN